MVQSGRKSNSLSIKIPQMVGVKSATFLRLGQIYFFATTTREYQFFALSPKMIANDFWRKALALSSMLRKKIYLGCLFMTTTSVSGSQSFRFSG